MRGEAKPVLVSCAKMRSFAVDVYDPPIEAQPAVRGQPAQPGQPPKLRKRFTVRATTPTAARDAAFEQVKDPGATGSIAASTLGAEKIVITLSRKGS